MARDATAVDEDRLAGAWTSSAPNWQTVRAIAGVAGRRPATEDQVGQDPAACHPVRRRRAPIPGTCRGRENPEAIDWIRDDGQHQSSTVMESR